ncbi:helix-turn-helix domain-containing protein [Bryocella elongata]|uniref:helix-turn-helix domain-containing protein n=1 Tax=Bryocella elongata TaxID=863522 RepID=UPI0038992E3D
MTTTITNTIKLDELVSQAEAARIRGVSKQAIANLIKRGRLRTTTVARRILLHRSEVELFEALPKTGRPPQESVIKRKPRKSRK